MRKAIEKAIKDNMVTIVFFVMCVAGFMYSGQTLGFLVSEVNTRLFRNFGLVFSLVFPVIAGVGLNFGIVLGAMAAQAALIFVTHWRIPGISALVLAAIISTLLAIVLGYLLGCLFNKTKGQEMITGMITGFFANGVYQLIFLVLIGTLIPMKDDRIVIYTGVGIKDTLKLEDTVTNALDNVWKVRMDRIVTPLLILGILYLIYRLVKIAKSNMEEKAAKLLFSGLYLAAAAVLLYLCNFNKDVVFALKFSKVPMIPLVLMILMGLLVRYILATKLGQDFRSIGNNMSVASASGIDVDRTRIIAIILSTVMASWGQIIFLQNIGAFTTYSSHTNVGRYAIAAILVGGASTSKATVKQCILGIVLFHTLFVIAPLVGNALLNDPAYGEYFREAVSYGVIALSLVLHVNERKNA